MRKQAVFKRILMTLVVVFIGNVAINAQLGGVLNKAKGMAKGAAENVARKQKEKADKKVKEVKDKATQKAIDKILGSAGRPDCPWTMDEKAGYNANDRSDPNNINTYLWSLENVSDEDVQALRDQMDARMKSDVKLLKAREEGLINSNNPLWNETMRAQVELKKWDTFYGAINQMFSIAISNVSVDNGGLKGVMEAQYLIHHNKGGGVGSFAVGHIGGDCKFVELGGNGTFLDDEKLNHAKSAVERMKKIKILCYNLKGLYEETGYKIASERFPVLYNLASMYAGVVGAAIEKNTPENIERQPRPKAGSLHSSLKAKALAIAKEQNPNVSDVIIVSSSWDVKKKGAVITHRSVYGYYLVKDQHGTKCMRRAWTQDYQGNGKYGALRAGGVGVEADFYIK